MEADQASGTVIFRSGDEVVAASGRHDARSGEVAARPRDIVEETIAAAGRPRRDQGPIIQ